MTKKILIFVIIFVIALLAVFFVYNYFTKQEVKAPTTSEIQQNFRGPTGQPYVKGPSGPPPGQ